MWKKYLNTDYSVSENGEIRKDTTGRILSQAT